MTKKMWTGLAAALLMAVLPAAQKPDAADTLLQTAIKKEVVDGNLAGAIEGYKKALAAAKGNRVVAAMALVHMAECYRKTGDAEARKIYEQVVREYGDQKEAVTLARTRLGGTTQPGRQANTLVWSGPKVGLEGRVSLDGRYLSYTDWDSEDLGVHEIATGTDRLITENHAKQRKSDITAYAEGSVISRDDKQIIYNWYQWDNNKERAELRLASLTGDPSSRRLYENPEINYFRLWDWSPDGKSVAVSVYRKDRTGQIGLVSVPDGSLRVLKSIDWRGASGMFFSPDGKYLGYDLAQNDTSSGRDVFVLALDGGSEIRAVAHPGDDRMMGWSPDGKWLLFASDRTGVMGLWGLRFAGGKPKGEPELLRQNIPIPKDPMGVTQSGTLYYGIEGGRNSSKIQIASFDFATEKYVTAPTDLTQNYLGSNILPDWSPDGRQLAYASLRPAGDVDHAVIVIRSIDTGEFRELRPKLSNFATTVWAPDGRSFLTRGTDLKGRGGILQIDVASGDVSTLIVDQPEEHSWYPKWAPDGKSFYFLRAYNVTKDSAYIRCDIATRKETELIRRRVLSQVNISPDGSYLVSRGIDESTNSRTLLLIPVSGGGVRELMRCPAEVPAGDLVNQTKGMWLAEGTWAPDSRSLFASKIRGGSVFRLDHKTIVQSWRVPIDGGAPRKLDDGILKEPEAVRFVVNPDGRRVAIVATEGDVQQGSAHRHEIWAIENFLPRTDK